MTEEIRCWDDLAEIKRLRAELSALAEIKRLRAEIKRLRAEVEALRAERGERVGAEPAGCPMPGACAGAAPRQRRAAQRRPGHDREAADMADAPFVEYGGTIDEALAAIEAQGYKIELDWQSIETAPKRQWVIGWARGWEMPTMMHWSHSSNKWTWSMLGDLPFAFPPTHWRPLPTAPKVKP